MDRSVWGKSADGWWIGSGYNIWWCDFWSRRINEDWWRDADACGANTYTGSTAINNGAVVVSGSLSDATAVSVSAGTTYEIGADDTVGSIAGSGAIKLGSSTLSVGGDNSSTEFSGVVSGTGGLTKQGTGTLTLSGVNTHSGPTSVNEGTLRIANIESLGQDHHSVSITAHFLLLCLHRVHRVIRRTRWFWAVMAVYLMSMQASLWRSLVSLAVPVLDEDWCW